MVRSRPDTSAELEDFVAAITGRARRQDAAAFAASILREANFDPNQPRDEQGRWTDGGSNAKGREKSRENGVSRTPAPEAPDEVIAGPSAKGKNALSATDWFEKHVWEPLERNGGTAYTHEHVRDVFLTGCIGLATLTIQVQWKPNDPRTGARIPYAVPDVRKGFLEFKDALDYRDKQNKENPIEWKGTTISGRPPRWRIFALLYSSENVRYPTAEPKKEEDGSYNFTGNDVLLTIVDASRKWATNFDFFTYSEPGDPWYNAKRRWIHADRGGLNMKLMATDLDGVQWWKKHNRSDLKNLYYFVAPERQFPKRK